jgi:predicted ATPase
MAFYLDKAIFINRAPFESIELDFKEKGINVLTAINGKGKTTIISHIIDAFHELARPNFENEFEGKSNKYYRISSAVFNINPSRPSFVYFVFNNNGERWDYVDIRNECSENDYNATIRIDNKIPFNEFSQELKDSKNVKRWCKSAQKDAVVKLFNQNLLTFFPSYRYEDPGYLNDTYSFKIEHKIESGYSGFLTNPLVVMCQFKVLANWLLDVALDEVRQSQKQNNLWNQLTPYFKKDDSGKSVLEQNEISLGLISKLSLLSFYSQQEILKNINAVIGYVLLSKYPQKILKLGVGDRARGGTRINIVDATDETIVYPSIFNMSSGEKALISIFAELLRQMDNLRIRISDIAGIVLIDEIDKNLHITMQHEILPKLLNMFPNVQFIVSAHSPFLNMGLADEAKERSQIIDLDNNGFLCEPTNNDLYREVYEMMINENNRFYNQYINLQDELKAISKPIVITEGKTDIIYILKAKEKLGITTDFNTINPIHQPNGDPDLQKLLKRLCMVNHNNKIIAVFDRDIPNTVQTMDDSGLGYKSYGNNVYGFCISAPQSRIDKGQNDISIEYLFSDDEIHTKLPNNCQLFFGEEFLVTSGRHINNKELVLKNQDDRGKRRIVENNGGQAVFDLNENNILAKKSDFAEAVKKDQIVISQDSWNNFRHIFDKIDTIINS